MVKIEDNSASNGSADLFGRTVVVTSLTEHSDLPSGLASIVAGDGLKIRGFVNRDCSTITVSELFSRLTANRTVVKARGTFGAGVLTADFEDSGAITPSAPNTY